MARDLASREWVREVIKIHLRASGPQTWTSIMNYCCKQTTARGDLIAGVIDKMTDEKLIVLERVPEGMFYDWNHDFEEN